MIYFLKSLYLERLFLRINSQIPASKYIDSIDDVALSNQDCLVSDLPEAALIPIQEKYKVRVVILSETSGIKNGLTHVPKYSPYQRLIKVIQKGIQKEICILGTAEEQTLLNAAKAVRSLMPDGIIIDFDFEPHSAFNLFTDGIETYFSNKNRDISKIFYPISHIMDAINPPKDTIEQLLKQTVERGYQPIYLLKTPKAVVGEICLMRAAHVLCIHDQPNIAFDQSIEKYKGQKNISISGLKGTASFIRFLREEPTFYS